MVNSNLESPVDVAQKRKKNIYITERYVGVANPDNIDGAILDVTSRKRIKKAN